MSSLAEDVRAGLTAPQKRLPPVWFYDARGSELFEAITRQPEYYLTDAEAEILERQADAIVEAAKEPRRIVELGAGSGFKTRILLRALLDRVENATYVPVDVSGAALKEAEAALQQEFPRLRIEALVARYGEGLRQLAADADAPPILILFLGSSIGNFEPEDAIFFLRELAEVMKPEDRLLLGMDRAKDTTTLNAAYNDAAGVTAAFNLNVLARMNRELDADFDLDAFEHKAFHNVAKRRMEMHLVSRSRQVVRLRKINLEVSFEPGETIHTENSYKYPDEDAAALVAQANLARLKTWTDAGGCFALHLLAPLPDAAATPSRNSTPDATPSDRT